MAVDRYRLVTRLVQVAREGGWHQIGADTGLGKVILEFRANEEKYEDEWLGEMHNEETLHKVYASLRKAGLSLNKAQDAIMEMQNTGILFRERVKTYE